MVKRYKTFDPQLVVVEHTTGSAVVLTNEAKLSLYKKSQKSGISTDILEEVYVRGYSIWNESFGQTPEQFAFDRVNSFVAGGFAAQLDDDLIEAYFSQTKPNQGFEHKGKVIGAISKSADGYISRRRKDPDKPTSVHLMQKHKTREDAEKHLISKSGLGEELSEKRGLWDNIHAKQNRIKNGSGEHMRKPGSEGAPTAAALKNSQNEAFSPEYLKQGRSFLKLKRAKAKASTNPQPKISSSDADDLVKQYLAKGGQIKKTNEERIPMKLSVIKEAVAKFRKKKGFVNSETSEKQSSNPNDSESRFDGTTSAKNVYTRETPGQKLKEEVDYDKLDKKVDGLIAATKKPDVTTSKGSADERRVFTSAGEVRKLDVKDPDGKVKTASVVEPNMTTKKTQKSPLLNTVRKVINK